MTMKVTPTVRLVIVAACLMAGWLYLGRTSRAEALPPREPLANLPLAFDGWNGRNEPPFDKAILDVLGVDDYIIRSYFGPQLGLGLYVGFYYSQRQGDTIHSPLNCLPGAGWQPIEQGRTTIMVRDTPGASATHPIEVNRVVIAKGLDKQLVYYWYQSRNRVVASEYWGKIYTVLDAVKYNRTDAALVRVVMPMPDTGSAEIADQAGTSFVQALFPLLSRFVPA